MFTSDKPYTLDSVVRMILTAAFLVGLVWLLGFLSSALVPFISALLLAYLLNPLTTTIERVVKYRSLAVFLSTVGLLGMIVALFWIVVPMIAAEFSHMGRVLSGLASNADFVNRAEQYFPADTLVWLKKVAGNKDIQGIFTSDGAANVAKNLFEKIMPGVKGLISGTANFFIGFLSVGVVLLYVVFLLADFGRIQTNWKSYLPARYRQGIASFLDEFELTMSLYFRGQIIIALLVGVLLSIGFLIIGLPLAIVLGMTIGLLNVAPYLGTLGLIPAILLAAIGAMEVGNAPWFNIGMVLSVFGVVQAIQEVVLVPRIQGESLGLSPWLILLSLSIWGQLLGFLGLLIALPMSCLCLSYYRRLLAEDELETVE